MTEITSRLRYLVSLDKPENGGPYGGIAAQECMKAMGEAADTIDRLAAALKLIADGPWPDDLEDAYDQTKWDGQTARRALEGL